MSDLGKWVHSPLEPHEGAEAWQRAQRRLRVRRRTRWLGRRAALLGLLLLVSSALWQLRTKGPSPGGPRDALPLRDGSHLDLDPGSQLVVQADEPRRVELELRRGRVSFDVRHDEHRLFLVHAGSVLIRVVGTQFVVTREPELASVEVAVSRGVVEITHDRLTTRLSAGEHWRAVGASPPTPDGPPAEEEATPQTVPGPAAAPRPAGSPPAGHPHAKASERGGGRPTAQPAPPDAGPTPIGDEAQALFDQLIAARRAGQWELALHQGGELLERHPADSRTALVSFELGRILMDRLNRPREAVDYFRRAVAHEQVGAWVEDARWRLMRALRLEGDFEACRREADAYHRLFPEGAYAKATTHVCDP